MPRAGLVTARDLELWAGEMDARAELPRLVRRLLLASGVERIDFPAGEGVQLHGWDGIVEAPHAGPFVPCGTSGWEVSVAQDVPRKANEDYDARTANALGLVLNETTFVALTLRGWPGKRAWATTRQAEKNWRDVLAFDSSDLETWLESCPAVHHWLSHRLGKGALAASSLDVAWEDWAGVTRPATPPELLLAGRDEAAAAICGWYRGSEPVLCVKAETHDEARAVAFAALLELPEQLRSQMLASTLVVRNLETWSSIVHERTPMLLIPLFEEPHALAAATRRGHRVILAMGAGDVASGEVRLPRLDLDAGASALERARFDRATALELARLARGSFSAFRRRLAVAPQLKRPTWATEVGVAFAATFAGRWSDESDADRVILGRLAGRGYEDVRSQLLRWVDEGDSPARLTDTTWYATAKLDAYFLLAPRITRINLQHLLDVAIDVLVGADVNQALPIEQRPATVSGFALSASAELRGGVADTLALLCAQRGEVAGADGWRHERLATDAAVALFDRIRGDSRLWGSLRELLPILAEAAPDAFCDAIEAGLLDPRGPIHALFDAPTRAVELSALHTGVLWGLEVVAWSSDHVARAAHILATLARIDPGGRIANRPRYSLRNIFSAHGAQTSAPSLRRLRILETLLARVPEVAWDLLLHLLPGAPGGRPRSCRPRWRSWVDPARERATDENVESSGKEVLRLMLSVIGTDGQRWASLIRTWPPARDRKWLLEHLNALEPSAWADRDRVDLCAALRGLISKHRSFAPRPWAMQADEIARFDAVLRAIEPADDVLRVAWLFSHSAELPSGLLFHGVARYQALATTRRDALNLSQDPVGFAWKLLPEVAEPETLGYALGSLGVTVDEAMLGEHIGSSDQRSSGFARGFASARINGEGMGWVAEALAGIGASWSPKQKATILAMAVCDRRSWSLAATAGTETEVEYWRIVRPWGCAAVDVEAIAAQFCKHGRTHEAIALLAAHVGLGQDIASPSISAALSAARGAGEDDDGTFVEDIATLMMTLASRRDVDLDSLADLEWAFIHMAYRSRWSPIVLHERLGREPGFFCEVVSVITGDRDESDPATLASRTTSAYALLHSWRLASDQLAPVVSEWVRAVRAQLTPASMPHADHYVGQALSTAIAETGALWPAREVCIAIDEAKSRTLENGFLTGCTEARGLVCKAGYEGGAQERLIADALLVHAGRIADEWPRTSALLRQFADDYLRGATSEDLGSEIARDVGR